MPRDDLILFLDLETTGSDERLDEIIETGVVALDATKDDFPEIDSFSLFNKPGPLANARMNAKDVVREMHARNGLLVDIRSKDALANITLVDAALTKWVRTLVGKDTTHIPYGGSGVAHFDRRFIRKFLPMFDKMITHWAYDVGVMRRSFLKAGVTPANVALESDGLSKTHRALDDARVHAAEWRYYQSFIRGDV